MVARKLSKKQLKEKQIIENQKFNRTMLISFSLLFLSVILILVFFTYWCDTKYAYRKFAWYGRTVPNELVRMGDDRLQYHESSKVVHENRVFYICSTRCHQHLINNFRELAFVTDAFSGKTTSKSDTIIGLKEKNQAVLIYFENMKNFKKYYTEKTRK